MMHLIGYLFAGLAFGMFIYAGFIEAGAALREQALYWFFASFVAALIPNIKQFRYKDFEVSFKEEVQKLENRVSEKIDKMQSDFFIGLEQVRAGEENLSPEYKRRRNEVFHDYAARLKKLSAEERFAEQEWISLQHLKELKLEVVDLKKMLEKLGFYSGAIDNTFTPQLVEALTLFQSKHNLQPIDGVFGILTYQKMGELLGA